LTRQCGGLSPLLDADLALHGRGIERCIARPRRHCGRRQETAQSGHVNAIWSPAPKTNFGLEYLYGRRSTHDGANGRRNRVQLGAQYFF
jgi:hypothetical protein